VNACMCPAHVLLSMRGDQTAPAVEVEPLHQSVCCRGGCAECRSAASMAS
jgi:hypothetical protein